MLFLSPSLVILFDNIDIIGPEDRWTNRIFSKIKQILGKKTFIALRDREILNFLVSYFFFFSRCIIRDGNSISLSVSDLRHNEFRLK